MALWQTKEDLMAQGFEEIESGGEMILVGPIGPDGYRTYPTAEQRAAWSGSNQWEFADRSPYIMDRISAMEPYAQEYRQNFEEVNKPYAQTPNYADPSFLSQGVGSGQAGAAGTTGSVFLPNEKQQKFYDFLAQQVYAPSYTPSETQLMTKENINRSIAGNASLMGSVRGVQNPEMVRREALKQQANLRQSGAGTLDILAAQEATTNRDIETQKYNQFLSSLEANRAALQREQEMRRDIAITNAQEANRASIAAGQTDLDRQKLEQQAEANRDAQISRWGAIGAQAATSYMGSRDQLNEPTVTSEGAQERVGSMTVDIGEKKASSKDINAPLNKQTPAQSAAGVSGKETFGVNQSVGTLPTYQTYKPVAAPMPTNIQATPGVTPIQNAPVQNIQAVQPTGTALPPQAQALADEYTRSNSYYKPFVDPNIVDPRAFLPSAEQDKFMDFLGNRIYSNKALPSVSATMVNQARMKNALESSGAMKEAKGGISPFLMAKIAGEEYGKKSGEMIRTGATLAEQEAGQVKQRTLAEQQQFMSALEANRAAMMNYQRMRTDIMTGNTSELNKANIAAAAAETERLRMEEQVREQERAQQARYGQVAVQLGLMAATGGATAPSAAYSVYGALKQ